MNKRKINPASSAPTLIEKLKQGHQALYHRLQCLTERNGYRSPLRDQADQAVQTEYHKELACALQDLQALCELVDRLACAVYAASSNLMLVERPGLTLADEAQVKEVFDQVIDELRANWRVEHPTKYEQVLEAFLAASYQGVTVSNLTPLFEDAARPANSAVTAIDRLNDKLAPKGLRIERPPQFYVIPLPEKD